MSDPVREQLDRILSSQALAGSDQLKRFLRVVVERTLNAQSDLLKEYNLGLEVFQRPPDYDPKVDPIVRVQARRLRAKLDDYYAGEGASDPIVIRIPKGAYVPLFESRAAKVPVAQPTDSRSPRWIWATAAAVCLTVALFLVARASIRNGAAPLDRERSVAVLPLKNYTGESNRSHLPDQVTELLTTELAKIKHLRVVSRTTASLYRDTPSPLPKLAESLGVRWIVEGGLGAEGSRVYIKLRVVDSATDRKIWADVYDCEVGQLVVVNARAAAAISNAIVTQLRSQRP